MSRRLGNLVLVARLDVGVSAGAHDPFQTEYEVTAGLAGYVDSLYVLQRGQLGFRVRF